MALGIINTNNNIEIQKNILMRNDITSYIHITCSEDARDNLLNIKEPILFSSISDLSLPDSPAAETYQLIFNSGTDIEIISSPALSSLIFKRTLINLASGTSIKETKLIMATATEILTSQIDRELNSRRITYSPITALSKKGSIIVTKKERYSVSYMKENLLDFGGTQTDTEVMMSLKLSRNTFYKYKKKIRQEIEKP